MRVISQDGTIDVPYEMVAIQRFRNGVYFLNRNLTGIDELINDIELAEYSTEEKAIKAMEMLREKYLQCIISLQGGESVLVQAVFQSNYWVLPKVFQFPQDDEIEEII